MSAEETKDLAYWERNVLALKYAEGWYYDDVPFNVKRELCSADQQMLESAGIKLKTVASRYPGWRRVLSLEGGTITFHIPDDFDVGTLPQVEPNWDGHTTEEKWRRVLQARGVHAP